MTSGDDLLTPWIDQFNTASENATTLLNNFALAPGVGLQQMIANWSGFLQDFFNDPTSSTLTSIGSEMQQNLADVLHAYTVQDLPPSPPSDLLSEATFHTLASGEGIYDNPHFLLPEIPQFLPPDISPAEVTPIINFLASPLSGMIMGDVGPLISPLVALGNSISAGDGLNETLANMVGAFFNGADLNLDGLIPLIEQSGAVPFTFQNLDIAFGGLLSPGTVAAGPYNDGIAAVGGSIFNSLGVYAADVPTAGTLDLTGYGIGPLGAWEGWAETIAGLLGAPNWTEGGDVTAPLTGVTLPVIPDDFLDAGAASSAAAADLSSLVQDVVSALGL